jgi:hypothetical protein
LRATPPGRRWLRHAHTHLRHLFPYLPGQSGYNKRLRAASYLVTYMIRVLARDTAAWHDDVWVVDSTPVECARSRDAVMRSDLAGWAQYGYCASHSRYFWGLRLHLVCTPSGLPVAFALAGAKAGEQETPLDIFTAEPRLLAERPGQTLIGDKNYFGADFQTQLAQTGAVLLRPARKGEPDPAASQAQRQDRRTDQALTHRLRPLTIPRNQSSRVTRP